MTIDLIIKQIKYDLENYHLYGISESDKIVKKQKLILSSLEELKQLRQKQTNILPKPVVRDGNGKLAKDYSPRDWYDKLNEEISELFFSTTSSQYAEELQDIITVCTSWLQSLGYDETARSKLAAAVNEKNEQRGYLKPVERELPKTGEIWEDYAGDKCRILCVFTDPVNNSTLIAVRWLFENGERAYYDSLFFMGVCSNNKNKFNFTKVDDKGFSK